MAIVGFFTPASTGDERSEKITMGITTLLSMSILMLMVADQMPTASDSISFIGNLLFGGFNRCFLSAAISHYFTVSELGHHWIFHASYIFSHPFISLCADDLRKQPFTNLTNLAKKNYRLPVASASAFFSTSFWIIAEIIKEALKNEH